MTRISAELELRWLSRYLNRELGGPDRDWFESYLLDKPDLLVFVEADLALREGLRLLAKCAEFDIHRGRRAPAQSPTDAGLCTRRRVVGRRRHTRTGIQ